MYTCQNHPLVLIGGGSLIWSCTIIIIIIIFYKNYNRCKKEKPFLKIDGEWDGILTATDRSGVSGDSSTLLASMLY